MTAPETLNQLLDRAASFSDAGLWFVDRREREQWVSWAEIRHAAHRIATSLPELGIAAGDRVALVYPTGRDFFHAFFGVLLAGAVPVALNPPVRLGRREEYHRRAAAMLDASGARLVLAERRLVRTLAASVEASRSRVCCRSLEELPERPPGRLPSVGPGHLALIQFSSGTTFDPKPVALSHRAVVAQARILNGFWPDQGGVRHSGVSWLPLYHDMGLIGGVFPALERPGVTTLLAPEHFVARPAVWLRAIARHRATISAAPNFAYRLAAEKIRDHELEGVELDSWRVALTGAEAVVPSVLRRFQERFAPWGLRAEALTPVYGLAEASLAVTFGDLDRGFETRRFARGELACQRVCQDARGIELTSLGRPVPGFEIRIAGDEGRPLPDQRVGRVHVRGPSLMEGYLDQPEATARAFHDDWLDTGDLGFVFDGELFVTGRAKDVVILNGRNHSPHEIEQAAGEVGGVRRGCVVAVSYLPEGAPGESLLVFVEQARNPEARVPPEELRAACAEAVLGATGLHVHRAVIHEPGALPRTSSGKLRRAETLRLHLAGELEEAGQPLLAAVPV